MIFKKLILKNYKTYYGTQEIDLTLPEQSSEDKKNIILIGGLNGAGKTTFLKAIFYILFGKRGITTSTDPKIINAEYEKLFSNVINNTFFDEGGHSCSVALVLETDYGAEWTLSVKWHVDINKKTGAEERELAIKETKTSPVKTVNVQNIDSYNRFIDKIIPFYAAPFFIFDGEEIRSLIEKQNTTEMKNAIQKISGISSNKELIKDLYSLKERIQKDLIKTSNSKKLDEIQAQYDVINQKLKSLIEKAEDGAKKISDLKNQQILLKQTRQDKLLNNSKSRETISIRLGQIESLLSSKQHEISTYFKNNMIQILLANKIPALKERIAKEKKYRNDLSIQSAVLQPYDEFINKLVVYDFEPPLTTDQITQLKTATEKGWFDQNPAKKPEVSYVEQLHDLNNTDLNYLQNLMISTTRPLINLINDLDKLNTEYEEILLKLKNAPEASDTKEEELKIEQLTSSIGQEQLRQTSRTKTINQLTEEKRALETQLTKNKVVGGNANQLYSEMQYLDRTIKAILRYEEEYTLNKAKIIKDEFSYMLTKLFRKQDEFGDIRFDIDSYSIRLFNDKMQEISIQDRSAGEMQMISSSLIWALTRASNLKLPVVIDTPLGRLDSQHRNHLIEHYYRYLSDQVIILSTDTEITKDYIDIMNQCSAKQYLLDYDESKKYTIIRDGYFKFVKEVK